MENNYTCPKCDHLLIPVGDDPDPDRYLCNSCDVIYDWFMVVNLHDGDTNE